MVQKIKFYVISCSSDKIFEQPASLYVWGETEHARWFPDTLREAKRRIDQCQEKYNCSCCDAEIHEVLITRTKDTKKQIQNISI